MVDVRIGQFLVTMSPGFKVGDQAPEGYLDWHEWAEIQHKGGLRQVQCPKCGKWQYPQELSTREIESKVLVSRARVPRITKAFVCLKCVEGEPPSLPA